jgi:hypothetical protein
MISHPGTARPSDDDAAQARTGSGRPRRRAAALLGGTALLAATAPLTTAVLAVAAGPAFALPISAPASARHLGAALNGGDPCQTTVRFSAASTGKLPACAGD